LSRELWSAHSASRFAVSMRGHELEGECERMGVLIANGVEALDVTLVGGDPVDVLRLGLEPGLTVLYGANGSGKSTVLDGIRAALRGVRIGSGEAWVRCRSVPAYSGFDSTLLTAIALAVRVRAGGDSSPELPEPPEDPEDQWQNAVLSLTYGADLG
jgi:hypothetical protein